MPYQQYQPYGADPLTAPGPTPAQIQQQREIAALLMNPAAGMQPIHANNTAYFSPWMGVSNIARQLMGDVRTGYANRLQQQMQGQYGQQYGEAIRQANPGAAPFNNAPSQSPAASGPLPFAGNSDTLKAAILMQESGNKDNIGNSPAGAIGPGQIMPQTFSSFAKPGESIGNPLDNRNVSGRILDSYMEKYGDPARAAVAYFSGPGNVAPPGSPTPWISDRKDVTGKSVSSYVADVTGRMRGPQMAQGGGAIDPRLLGAIEANPAASEATKGALRGFAVPQPTADVYGQPGVIGPQGGARPIGVQPGFQPGFRAPVTVGADGQVSTTVPQLSPGQGGPQNLQQQLQPLVTMGQQFGQQGAANKAVQEAQQTDVKTANDAVQVRTVLRTMKDDLLAHGDQMVWGPTSEWVTNLKRALVQHAPGVLSKDQIEGLASADSFDKLSAQLQTLVGRMAGNTDLSLMQGHRSVPGSQNSKQGALALIDMLDQAAGLNAQWMAENQQHIGQPGYNYMQAKREFFDKNKIVNPITRNPISVDLAKPQAGETKIINGKTYTKINGQWHEGM